MTTKIKLTKKLSKLTSVKIDGSLNDEIITVNEIDKIEFNPNEISMYKLE